MISIADLSSQHSNGWLMIPERFHPIYFNHRHTLESSMCVSTTTMYYRLRRFGLADPLPESMPAPGYPEESGQNQIDLEPLLDIILSI